LLSHPTRRRRIRFAVLRPTPGTTGENDDLGYGQAPAGNEPGEAAPADNDANYSGPTPGTTGENDDPSYSTEPATDSLANPDAGIAGNTDPARGTVEGRSGDGTRGGETDTGYRLLGQRLFRQWLFRRRLF
jgi:hypothetical protein